MSRHRVLIIQPYVPRYRESFFRDLRGELSRSGVDLVVAASSAAGVQSLRTDSTHGQVDVRVRQLKLGARGKHLLVRVPPPGWISADLVILEHAVKNLESYVIISTRGLLGKRTALWGHGATITHPTTRITRILQSWMARHTGWYFAYTEGSKSRALGLGASPHRVTVVNNSIEFARVEPPRQHRLLSTIGSDRWVAAYIGGLDEPKRIPVLLEASRELHRADPRFLLVVAGRGELETEIARLEDEPWLLYIGEAGAPEKAWLASFAKLLMIPGRVGLVAVDSFAMGLPIVTRSGERHAPEFEYLNEGNSVVTSNGAGAMELAEAVRALMADSVKLETLRAGCEASAQQYTLESFVSRFASGTLRALDAAVS